MPTAFFALYFFSDGFALFAKAVLGPELPDLCIPHSWDYRNAPLYPDYWLRWNLPNHNSPDPTSWVAGWHEPLHHNGR
jgi:hypothetical protein